MTLPEGYKTVSTGYTPRPLQYELHRKLKRFNVLVMHRRFGKTVFAINHMIAKGLSNPLLKPQYAYLAPFRDQAKRIAWGFLKQYTENLPNVTVNEADLRIDINRPDRGDFVRFMLLGADNPRSLKGIYLDGVMPDEYAEIHPSVWDEVLRPTLSDRIGWAIFLGTPRGRNHFYEAYNHAMSGTDPDWFAAMYKASETGIISKEELESAKRTMPQELYDQEYECSFQAGMVGSYFSKEIQEAEKSGKFTNVPYDPGLLVDTYWDLGISDVTAVWFVQKFGLQYRLVDYFEESDLNIPKLLQETKERISKNRATLGKVFLPHDAKVRELGTGKSRQERFIQLGVRPKIVPRVEDKLDSIHEARMIFPRCIFDSTRCKRGIDALMNYQRKWDSKAMAYSKMPLHNWASNGSDAFQCFAMGVNDRDDDSRNMMPQKSITAYSRFAR